jgi:hypothetical protein
MRVTVPLKVSDDDGHAETVTEVVGLEQPCQPLEPVGLPPRQRPPA